MYREDIKKPVPGKGQSLIRILVSSICNTDKEILKGYKPDFTGIMGHEFVGFVEESDQPNLIGKRVVGELNAGCGHCLYCKTGREKHCTTRKVIGIDNKDGCFAEYMVWENHLLHIVPDELPNNIAIFTEPLAAALEIPTRIPMSPEKNIAVIGDGRLSFMITQVLSLHGMAITVIGRHEEKLKLFSPYAKTVLQADDTYEIVVDATGSKEGLALAKQIVRKQGTIVVKSTYAGTIEVDMSYFVINEITIAGSRCGPFEPALNLLSRKFVTLPPIELFELKDYQLALKSRAFKSGFLISHE